MKYYSEEVVKKIITDAMRYGMEISQSVPMSADSYPSFEIPDKHGRIIDSSRAEKFCEDWANGKIDYLPLPDEILSILLFSTPTILEATE